MGLRSWFRERYMTSPLVYNLRLVWEYHDVLRTRIPFVYRRFLRGNIAASRRAATRLKGKEVIEVAFFLSMPGMWKADYLFRRMAEDARFHPYVVLIPYTVFKSFDKEEMWRTLRRTEAFVKEKGAGATLGGRRIPTLCFTRCLIRIWRGSILCIISATASPAISLTPSRR